MGWAAGRMAGTEGQDLDVSPHPWVPQPPHTPLRSSTGSPDRTGITVPPPQHGKAAPRAWVRGCRAFIHHTTSRHGTGVQDRAGRGPVIGAESALHATLAWADKRKQEDRAGASVALPEAPQDSPQAGDWHMGKTGEEAEWGPGLNQPPPHLKQISPLAFVNPLLASAQPPTPREMPSTTIYRVRQN